MSKMAEKDYENQQTDTDGTEGVVNLEKEMKPKKKEEKVTIKEKQPINNKEHIDQIIPLDRFLAIEEISDNNTRLLSDCVTLLKDYKKWLDDIDVQLKKVKDRLGL